MQRLTSFLVAALLLSLVAPALPGTEAWAQGRGRNRGATYKKSRSKLSSTSDKRPAEPAPAAADPVTGEASTAASTTPPSRGPARIDFDDRLIQGQTNKSGAVYLYDRKELKQRSMVRERESFRSEILSTVYDP